MLTIMAPRTTPRPKRRFRPTFIRSWREYRNLSLAQLVDRLVDPNTFEPLMTAASLSRIERGLQPYSQPQLEAIAEALGCQAGDLITRNPTDSEAIWSIWETLDDAGRKRAIEVLKVLAA